MSETRQNCFFFIDETKKPDERVMSVICMNCHQKEPDVGWFWDGNTHGYGPYDFTCDKCGHMIYKHLKGSAHAPK